MTTSIHAAAAVLAAFGLLTGCAAPQPTPKASSEKQNVLRYLPEGDDVVCKFDTESSATGRGLYAIAIRRVRSDLLEVTTSTGTRRLRIAPHALTEADGTALLVAPLEPHAQWAGDRGTVEILETGVSVTVKAGRMRGCLKTLERSSSGAVKFATVTTYCPTVGPALIEHEQQDSAGRVVSERAELSDCGERLNVHAAGF